MPNDGSSVGSSHLLWLIFLGLKVVGVLAVSAYIGLSEARAITAAKSKAN